MGDSVRCVRARVRLRERCKDEESRCGEGLRCQHQLWAVAHELEGPIAQATIDDERNVWLGDDNSHRDKAT